MSTLQIPPDPARARIGLIIPSVNSIVEQELVHALPEGVVIHVTRVRLAGLTPTDVIPAIGHAAAMLAEAGCKVIAFHCTSSSMEEGLAANERLLETIRAAAPGVAALTTASALLDAIAALDLDTLALLTPYTEIVNARQQSFFEEAGITVCDQRATNVNSFKDYCFLEPDYWKETLLEYLPPSAPAVLLSCANLRTLEMIESAEAAMGRPLLTSNQATLWAALRHAGVNDILTRLGRLGHCNLPGLPQRVEQELHSLAAGA